MSSVDVGMPGKTFLHLLGKTGTGKSSTGNTILGQRIFKTNVSSAVMTRDVQRVSSLIGGRSVEVVDGPGLEEADKRISQDAVQQFRQVIEENEHCAHVFLIVCRYGEPFTWQDQALIDALQKTFGQRVFQDHGIVVMTFGDSFTADTEDEGMTFPSWCQAQGGTFSDLLRLCRGRVVLVDNSRRTPTQHREEVISRLNWMMDSLDHNATSGFSLTRQDNAEGLNKSSFWRCNIF